jgi:catechol 2,3-dioxygenase-like lactoylglutathione lyase family enzyme
MESFFIEMLGARLVERRKFGTADGAMLDLNGTTIFLRAERENDKIVGDSSQHRYGYDHLGLEVDDLDETYRVLTGKGVTFTLSPTESEAGRMAFIEGPDGIAIELFQTVR